MQFVCDGLMVNFHCEYRKKSIAFLHIYFLSSLRPVRGFTLYMVHSFHCDVKTFLVIQTVPADWSNLTICTDKVFDSPHVFSEAHVLKSEHVVHEPVGGQSVPIH